MRLFADEGTAGLLRGALALLVVIGLVGSAVTLAYDRHWEEPWQLAPWITLVLVAAALGAVALRASRVTVRLARVIAVLAVVSALLGLWQHYDENYNTAPLDGRYSDRWDAMPVVERVWVVANGDVGHVPVPSAAVLIPIALALWMTTLGLREEVKDGDG